MNVFVCKCSSYGTEIPMIRREFLSMVFVCAVVVLPVYAQESDDIKSKAQSVLRKNCLSCHKGPGSEGGDFDVMNASTMTIARNNEKPYVIPGNPEMSYLFKRIQTNQMPPQGAGMALNDEEKKIIREWIQGGAKSFIKKETARNHVSWVEILKHVNRDLENLEKENSLDVKFTRYFTITNLHNNQKYTDEDLKMFRAALSKAINSLSWRRGIVLPRPIDQDQTIFAIDVRKLNWDINAEKVWETITNKYPYGIRYGALGGMQALEINKLYVDICRKTNCEIPILRADWFVTVATRPPLYHEILRIPENASLLEKKLDVNTQLNFERNEVARAGFNNSGISKQNRLVERHDANYGAYWKSYDFLPRNNYSNLTKLPLGPDFPKNKYKNYIFNHDGGEIIFNLPNGLQAYMLVDGKDKRINEGPVEAVSDKSDISGSGFITNGISCIGCHKKGMIKWADDAEVIRHGSVAAGEALEKVNAIYPDKKKMTALLNQDQKLFLTSLREAVIPFVPEKAEDLTSLSQMDEPISYLVKKHRDEDLTIFTIAAELDEKNPQLIMSLIQNNAQLNQEFGLKALALPNGSIKRAEWEKFERFSTFQKLCIAMGKGNAILIEKIGD
jgi:hypothetical protein